PWSNHFAHARAPRDRPEVQHPRATSAPAVRAQTDSGRGRGLAPLFISLRSSTWTQPMNTRRIFLARSAAALSITSSAFARLGNAETTPEGDVVAATSAPTAHRASEDQLVRPFKVQVSKARLDDLRRRVAATRWPGKEIVDDASQGVQLATLQALARRWATAYDWSPCDATLTSPPQ